MSGTIAESNLRTYTFPGSFDEDDDRESDDDAEDTQRNPPTMEYTVFAVDCNEGMFERIPGEERVPFQMAMANIKDFCARKIIEKPNDCVGIIFYNTREVQNERNHKGVYVWHDLKPLDVGDVKSLMKWKGRDQGEEQSHDDDDDDDDDDDGNAALKEFVKEYGCTNDGQVYTVLWEASALFATMPRSTDSYKQVFIYTNQDICDNQDQDNAEARAKTMMEEQSILVQLMHILDADHKRNNRKFDVDAFWKYVLQSEDDAPIGEACTNEVQLANRMRRRRYNKRTTGRIRWHIGPNMQIGIARYNMIQSAEQPKAYKLQHKTNDPVVTGKCYLKKGTGTVLMKNELAKRFEYGRSYVYFSQEEKRKLCSVLPPGMTLLGFKPIDALKKYYNIANASFIYPDEASVKGSTVVFAALLHKCLELKKAPVCVLVPRKDDQPRLVFLLPQDENTDPETEELIPPGFWLVPLPYVNDIRKLDIKRTVAQPNEQLVELATGIVQALTVPDIDLASKMNPALQKFYTAIEVSALGEKPQEIIDHVKPHVEGMERIAGDLMHAFVEEAYRTESGEHYNPMDAAQLTEAQKRKADGPAAGGRARKKARVPNEEDVSDMRDLYQQNKISSLTLKDLRDFLEVVGLPKSGTKAAVVERITDYFNKQQP